LSSDPLGRPQLSSAKLDEVRRFVGLIAMGAWALVGLTAYTAIIFYMGWRVGVVEGAPLGGPVHDRVFRLSESNVALMSFPLPRCVPRIEGWLQ
jgi:hypothetical protein